MYRQEVPQYATLERLVAHVSKNSVTNLALADIPRHGALRLASLAELRVASRFFNVMGMRSVGHYDLSAAGLPVHATAFRPTTQEGLVAAPFRLFVSVLRPELLTPGLQPLARLLLNQRGPVFNQRAIDLVSQAEVQGGLTASEADDYVQGGCDTLAWRNQISLTKEEYDALKADKQGNLLIDIMAFRNPHLNHLTPATADMDAIQQGMAPYGLEPKDRVEGPPERRCNVLLRQTSFLAVDEGIVFDGETDKGTKGSHSARFGEVEQRGAALTAKGRARYDEAMGKATRTHMFEESRQPAFKAVFDEALPDDWEKLKNDGLIWVEYSLTEKGKEKGISSGAKSLQQAIADDLVSWKPIQYEDFLPLSAAGIFQSNLHHDSAVDTDEDGSTSTPRGSLVDSKRQLREALGEDGMVDEMKLYEEQQILSAEKCCEALSITDISI